MLALGLASVAAAARPEPNAFLNKPAHSVEDLVRQASRDPEVMDRFMRHFAMKREDVLAMLSGLHLGRIKKDTPMVVYNANDAGVIGSKLFVIKAGALVFLDKDGTPVLKKTCANPLVGRFPMDLPEVETEPLVGPLKQGEEGPVAYMPVAELVEPPFEPVPPAPEPPIVRLPLGGTEDAFVEGERRTGVWPYLLIATTSASLFEPPHPRYGSREDSPVPGPAAALVFAGPAAAAWRRRSALRQNRSPKGRA